MILFRGKLSWYIAQHKHLLVSTIIRDDYEQVRVLKKSDIEDSNYVGIREKKAQLRILYKTIKGHWH